MVLRDSFWGYILLLISKTGLSTSMFIVKYWGISLILTAFSVASFGSLVISLYMQRRRVQINVPSSIRYLNVLRFIMRDLGLLGVWVGYLHGSIPRASALCFCGALFLTLLNRIVFKERVPLWRVGMMLLAWCGVVLIVGPWSVSAQSIYVDIVVIASALLISSSTCLLKYLLNKGLDVTLSLRDSAMFRMVLAVCVGLCCWPHLVSNVTKFSESYMSLCLILFGVVVLQNFALVLHMVGIKKGRLVNVPFMDVWRFGYEWLAGFFVFHHQLHSRALCGALIVSFSVFVMGWIEWKASSDRKKEISSKTEAPS